MKSDKKRWEEKYKKGQILKYASQFLVSHYRAASGRRACDIACGNGRNAKFLASRGFSVDAIDISPKALSLIEGYEKINRIEADLDFFDLKEEEYDLVVNINFLNRSLFEKFEKAMKPGGVLIFESFVHSEKNEADMNPNYLLKPKELLYSFSNFDIIEYKEKMVPNIYGNMVKKAYMAAIRP